ATFTGVSVSKAGVGYTLVAKAGAAISTPSTPFTIYKATHFSVSKPTAVQAGTAFTVTVVALDAFNHLDTTYLGTVHFTSTASPMADLPIDYTFQPGDAGQHTFTVTLNRSGGRTVTVTDMLKAAVHGSRTVSVAPGALAGFLVSGYPSTTVVNVA